MALLEIRDLSFTYPDMTAPAIDGVSLDVERGELITVIGATGSGKSTLLRLLKPELRQNGTLTGSVTIGGADVAGLSPAVSAAKIAYVAQNPEEQIVTDRVWHELAFTLENLGAGRDRIARRVAEVAAFFGIEGWYRQDTASLSGGQKQLLNLAAVMTTDPEILLLDEPTAQLDPVAAARFLDAVHRLCRETGVAVIITEHRAEELIPRADQLVILDHGRIAHRGDPRALAASCRADSAYLSYLPCAAQLYVRSGGQGEPPLSISEGQRYIREFDNTVRSLDNKTIPESHSQNDAALTLKDVYFRYDRRSEDILRGLSLNVRQGEVMALLGANGAGKSTLLSVAAGLRRPYSGALRLFGKALKDYRDGTLYENNISLLPQDVESVFLHMTVREELKGCEHAETLLPYDLSALYDRHPYDLSGGERQLVALCKALKTHPRLLLLDEPSKGLDPDSKRMLAEVILTLKQQGMTVLAVSHDVDFAALCADRCALFFDGGIAACEPTADFLRHNRYYTTAAARVTRGVYDDGYTVDRAVALLNRNGRRL